MNRTTRVLAFPLSVAAIAALDGCQGVAINDPSVRPCHDDTVRVQVVTVDGRTLEGEFVFHDDPTRCRKAA